MTDATGFSIQPGRFEDAKHNKRRPRRKGHYFVQIADRDHIFFEFADRHTTKNVRAMFKGFDGYVQADASSVYDALFRPAKADDDGCIRTEVGCWSHVRRKYWEAALAKQSVAREALVRIGKIFEFDASFRKGNPPSKVKKLRQAHLRPLVDEFLEFARVQFDEVKDERGSLRAHSDTRPGRRMRSRRSSMTGGCASIAICPRMRCARSCGSAMRPSSPEATTTPRARGISCR